VVKFLRKLLVFLIPFFVLFPILEFRLSKIPNFYNQKKSFLESQLNEIEILSTGSSHGDSINPAFLDLAGFNLSHNAEDIYYDVQVMMRYLEKMPRLKIILFPISYFSLDYRLDSSLFPRTTSFYKMVWGIWPPSFQAVLNTGNFSYIAAFGWAEVLTYIKNGFKSKNTVALTSNGWWQRSDEELPDSPEAELEAHQRVVGAETILMNERNTQLNLDLLSQFIETCRSRGIKIVFLTTPVHHLYFEKINEQNYLRTQGNLENLLKKYNIPYHDYFKDERFSSLDFYNPDHLNTKGSEKFSRIINQEIIQPLLTVDRDEFNACPRVSEKPCMIK